MSLVDVKGQRSLRRTLLAMVVVGLAHVALFLLLHPGLWNGKTFLGWDAVEQQWPDIVAVRHSLADGELPLWSPYEKTGYPIIGDPEVSALYPVHWLLYLLMGVFGDGYWIVLFKALLHYAIAAVGMQLFLARYGVNVAGQWLGSTAYILNSRVAKTKDQASLGVAAWFPYMVIATEEVIKRPSWRSGLLLGSVTAVNLHAGYPPNTVRNLMAIFPYAVVLLFWRLRQLENPWRELRRVATAGALAVGVAVALGLPLVFSMQSFSETARASMSIGEVLSSGTRPADFAQLIAIAASNHLAIHLYVGMAVTLAALYAVFNGRGRVRQLWTALAVVFLVMACGSSTFLLPVLVELFRPVFGAWRAAQLYVLQAVFFIAALAGLGMDDLLRPKREPWIKPHWLGLFALVFCSIVYVAISGRPKIPSGRLDAAMISIGVALVLTVCLYWMHTHHDLRRKRRVLWVIAPLLVADLGLLVRPIYNIQRPVPPIQRDVELSRLPRAKKEARLADFRYFHYRVGLRHDLREIFGRRTALISKRFATYENAARRDVRLLAAANVAYVAGANWRVFRGQKIGPTKRLTRGVVEIVDPAPFGYWTSHVEVVHDAPAALGWMRAFPAGLGAVIEKADLEHFAAQVAADSAYPRDVRAVLQGWVARKPGGGAVRATELSQAKAGQPPVAVTIAHFGRNRLKLDVQAPQAGLVVINEAMAPGWVATVDGQRAPIARVNYLFRGVLVSAGMHRIEMVYRPALLMSSLYLYLATVLVLLSLLAWALLRYLKRQKQRVGKAG